MIRALMIEDSEDDALLVLRELKRGGLDVYSHRVDTATELEDALARGGWDVVLSDYMMPTFSGLNALAMVRTVDPDLPFIVVSGAVGEEVAVDAMKAGAHDYVMKSNLARLVQAVRREIAESESRRRRKQVESQLVQSEERLQLVVRATRDAVWDWSPQSGTGWVNQAFRSFLGVPDNDASTHEWWVSRLHPDDRERVLEHFLCGDKVEGSAEIEYRIRKADGEYADVLDRWFAITDRNKKPLRMIGAIMDLTDRKRIENELKDVNIRLKHLSARILSVQEEERRSLARDLHDDVGQVLTALKISLETMARSGRVTDLGLSLAELSDMANRALTRVRDLTLALRPPQLDDLGLTATLRWHLDQQSRVSGWQGVFESDELPGRLAPGLETTCFRVVQEALTNAARHAKASRVDVELRNLGEHIRLTVRDDGEGFDLEEVRDRMLRGTSVGLAGMEERVLLAGGQLDISSAPGAGTRLEVLLPIATLPDRGV